MTFTSEQDPREWTPRDPSPLDQKGIDALMSALPLDDDRRPALEADLLKFTKWAIDAVIQIQELGPERFMQQAFWQARGEIDGDGGKFNKEALRKFAVQMIVLGQYNASKKIASTIQD